MEQTSLDLGTDGNFGFDEDDTLWIANFVAKGGDESQAKSIRRRMKPAPQNDQEATNEADKKSDAASPPTQISLIDEAEASELAQTTQLGFMARAMIFASLPSRKMEGRSTFKKKCGQYEMILLNDPEVGLPYGRLPRIIVSYLSTEAKRTGEQRIFVGNSQREFAELLGLGTNGGKRGDLTRLGIQGHRLFTSRITLTHRDNNRFKWQHINIADNGDVLWGQHDPSPLIRDRASNSSWPSYIDLSEPFARECINHAVPVDINTIRNLSGPMAIDVYIWLTYRYFMLSDEMTLNWPQLKWLFGDSFEQSPRGLWNFKAKFRETLTEITKYYPDAKFMVDMDRGITLLPSRPHIASK